MALVLRYATIPVRDVVMMAKFWSAAVDGSAVGAGVGALVRFEEEDVDGPGLLLPESPDAAPCDTGLAFRPMAGTLKAETVRLIDLGAQIVRKVHRGFGLGEVILADPEGNTFTLVSSAGEVRAFEESEDGPGADQDPGFWADADHTPHRSTAGSVSVVLDESARD
ncbi:VOC family protein [Streptacidiphilus sp. MAP5-3]|uniref:VOC family protein n=1 Tax=unclassified Streptacidiphilus TaxID=2643834 RepID=UPI0035166DE4